VADVVRYLIKAGVADLRIRIIGYDKGSIAILRAFLERHCRSRVVEVFDISERLDEHAGSWLQHALDLFTAHPADAVVLIPCPDLPPGVGRMVHGLPYRSYLAPSLATLEQLAVCVPNRDGAPELEALGFVRIADRPLSGWRWFAKDMQDRLIALCLLVVLVPVLVIVAAAIKLSSAGPVLFRQMRRGHGGTSFEIYKFRTMRVDPDAGASNILQLTTRNDSRVFPVGRILRSTSIDEIPQLVNVLKGDMWIVGPRPHSPLARVGDKIYAEAVDNYLTRYRIKPGITGWAQVCGWRGPTETVEQLQARVDHDLYYIDHWSPVFDAWILLKTLFCGAMHVNAF
jgi:lipopolysaccharide/colanic/teichoic acid biosynthesis glycosyltransferase